MSSSGSIFGNNSSNFSPFLTFANPPANKAKQILVNFPPQTSPPFAFKSKNAKIDGKHLVRCTALNPPYYCKKQLRIKFLTGDSSFQQSTHSQIKLLDPTSQPLQPSPFPQLQLQIPQQSNTQPHNCFQSTQTPTFIAPTLFSNTIRTGIFPVRNSPQHVLFNSQPTKSAKSIQTQTSEAQFRNKTPFQMFYSAFTQNQPAQKSTLNFPHSKYSSKNQEQVRKILSALAETEQFKELVGVTGKQFNVDHFSKLVMKRMGNEQKTEKTSGESAGWPSYSKR